MNNQNLLTHQPLMTVTASTARGNINSDPKIGPLFKELRSINAQIHLYSFNDQFSCEHQVSLPDGKTLPLDMTTIIEVLNDRGFKVEQKPNRVIKISW